jgi:hypothetical protein
MHNDSSLRGVTRGTRQRDTLGRDVLAWTARTTLIIATAAGLAACSDDVPTQPGANVPDGGPKSPSAVIHIIPEGTTFPAKIAFATGMVQGKDARVQIYDKAHNQLASFYAFSGAYDFSAGVSVAVGDVNGDGWPEIIAGEGNTTEEPGTSGSEVSVWDGKTGTLIQTWKPFGGFQAGIRVGAADLDLDGKAEILACTGEAVWGNRALALKLGSTTPVSGSQISAYRPDGYKMSHGCRIAGGDLTGDGYPEMVAYFDDRQYGLLFVRDLAKVKDVLVRNPLGSYDKEADVAVGDVNGDKIADVMLSLRQDSAIVRVFDGSKVKSNVPLTLLKEIKPVYYWQSTGLDIATHDLNGDGVVDLLFKPTRAMPFWSYSAVGANAGPALTAVTALFWFVEPGQLYPGGPVG